MRLKLGDVFNEFHLEGSALRPVVEGKSANACVLLEKFGAQVSCGPSGFEAHLPEPFGRPRAVAQRVLAWPSRLL